jgi:hypothetical protein
MKLTWNVAALSAALIATAPAAAAPVTVNLRVEGSSATYFEGPVTTDARPVMGHPCAGTGTTAAPTMITALDDAAATRALFWKGTWYDSFGDFFVDEIGTGEGAAATSDRGGTTTYWVLAKNFKASDSGGCQTTVADGDRVLFAFGSEVRPLLELSGAPVRAAVGEPFDVLVTQYSTNQAQPDGAHTPAPGALVEGQLTGPDGQARVSFAKPGLQRFKATREGSVRSNAAQVCVYAPGSGDCGTAPASAPVPPAPTTGSAEPADEPRSTVAFVSVRDGARYALGRAPRRITGSATGPGVDRVELRLRRYAGGRCTFLSPSRRRFVRSPSCGAAGWVRLAVRGGRWTLKLGGGLARGPYVAQARALRGGAVIAATRVHFRVG